MIFLVAAIMEGVSRIVFQCSSGHRTHPLPMQCKIRAFVDYSDLQCSHNKIQLSIKNITSQFRQYLV